MCGLSLALVTVKNAMERRKKNLGEEMIPKVGKAVQNQVFVGQRSPGA